VIRTEPESRFPDTFKVIDHVRSEQLTFPVVIPTETATFSPVSEQVPVTVYAFLFEKLMTGEVEIATVGIAVSFKTVRVA